MHPLEAQTLWLLGAAAAGDKDARTGLSMIPTEALADVHRPLLTMRDAIVDNNAEAFRRVFEHIFRVEIKKGERATAAIIRSIAGADVEWAVRALAMATTTVPAAELIKRLRVLTEALEKMEKEKKPGSAPAKPEEKK